jgi:hypothetical protein
VWQPPTSFGHGDPNWKTRAKVTTSDDKTFKSKKLRVGDMMATEEFRRASGASYQSERPERN